VKNPFLTYHVVFGLNGGTRDRPFRAIDPGHAYAKCIRQYPSARLIDCYWQSENPKEPAISHYPPPSVVAITPEPEIIAEQTTFGFADQLSFKQKETSWRQDVPPRNSNRP